MDPVLIEEALELTDLFDVFGLDEEPTGLVLLDGDDDDDDDTEEEDGDDDNDDDDSDDDKDDDDEDEKGGITQAERDELNRLRRERADKAKKARQRKSKQAKTESALRSQLDAETRRADENEAKLTKYQRTQAVEKVAARMKAVYPDSIARELTEDELHDEKSIERGLKRVKREKPRLFDEQRRSGGEVDDDDDTGRRKSSSNGDDENAYGFSRLAQVQRKNT